ncbi:MAG: GtrA family protein, partial [Clostridia bacterium]|nr:GtrA family protein [Clostridia bacterium]
AGKEFTGFIGARIFSFVVETLIMFVMVSLLHFSDFIAKVVVGIIVVILNYVFSKLLIFKKNKV